jgi:tetratricopeptide (TPR) repeat protein
MANLVATREALERFAAELPLAGLGADRLRRTSEATRALIEQALAIPHPETGWIDHNLAVVVAGALSDEATAEAGLVLFIGVRRRLGEALSRDPDDLAAALALALGAAGATDDERTAADIAAVGNAVGRPQAGPALVGAAVKLVLAVGREASEPVIAAAAAAVGPVKAAVDALSLRLSAHPDTALDRARLELLAARDAEGDARQAGLDRMHAVLADHEARFGPTAQARGLRGELLSLRARSGGAASDVRRDAIALFEAQAADRSLSPDQADRLIRTIERTGKLDAHAASHLSSLIEGLVGRDERRWHKPLARLLREAGDEAAFITLQERALREEPDNSEAARVITERLVRNLRAGLPSPFESEILERALAAVPQQTLARWSADDVAAVMGLATKTFGARQAAHFASERLLHNRTLSKRDGLWHRTMELWGELGDEDGMMEIARRAVRDRNLPEARLLLAEKLLERGERLDEADELLRPLCDARGPDAAKAHRLRDKLSAHPALKAGRRDALLAFEERVGIGTDKRFAMRVIHTTPSYVLVELSEVAAPDAYEHKHVRTLVRAQDLPSGVSPLHMRRGDGLEAPLRGQDADPDRDKGGIRVYWVSDPTAIRLQRGPAEIAARLDQEEARFGIGGDAPVALKVGREGRSGHLSARIFAAGGGTEMGERARVEPEQLPEGTTPEQLGKGKRYWARVVRRRDLEGSDGVRVYVVEGTLDATPPAGAEVGPEPGPEESGGRKKRRRGGRGGGAGRGEAEGGDGAGTGGGSGSEADSEAGSDSGSEADSDSEADSEADSDSDSGADSGSEADSGSDSEADSGAETETDSEPKSEVTP